MKEKTPDSIILRGREFTYSEISIINELTIEYFEKGRTAISRKVCENLKWVQPNGWLKDRACRDVLRILHNKGIIELPNPKIIKTKSEKKSSRCNEEKSYLNSIPIFLNEGNGIIDFHKIKLLMVKGSRNEVLWNKLVNDFHYLGFSHFVGRSLKYLVFLDEKIVGAIGFCDPAWSLTCRDKLLNEIFDFSKEAIRHHGVNNGRFLILPWIKIPNLASNILGKALKAVKIDWLKYYNVKPYYVETFVDPSRFTGTCYKASNWKQIGTTKGYKKKGYLLSNSQIPKNILIYSFY